MLAWEVIHHIHAFNTKIIPEKAMFMYVLHVHNAGSDILVFSYDRKKLQELCYISELTVL